MVSRTRKVQKQKGGSIPHLPRSLAPISGADKKTLMTNFFTNNGIYYVAGHGAVLKDETYEVPPNTYVLHVIVSGKVLYADSTEIEDFVKERDTESLWRLLTGQDKGFGTSEFFSPNRFEPEKDTLAIYKPGDRPKDMILQFSNKGGAETDILISGVYQLPVEKTLFDMRTRLFREKTKLLAQEKEKNTFQRASANDKKKKEQELTNAFALENDPFFQNHKTNLMKTYFTRDLTATETENDRFVIKESKLVNDASRFPIPTAGGFRLFIVWACRGVYCSSLDENARSARRHSINLHEYEEGVKEQYAAKEALKAAIRKAKADADREKAAKEEAERKRAAEENKKKKATAPKKENAAFGFKPGFFTKKVQKTKQQLQQEEERQTKILNNALKEVEEDERKRNKILNNAIKELEDEEEKERKEFENKERNMNIKVRAGRKLTFKVNKLIKEMREKYGKDADKVINNILRELGKN